MIGNLKKKKGLSLVESLVGVAIASSVAAGSISFITERAKERIQEQTSNDIYKIISGVEKRFALDGYNINDWSNTSWNDSSEVFDDLISKQLIAMDNECGQSTGWKPSLDSESKTKLVPCNLWSKIPYGMEVSAELTADPTGFVEDFNLYMSFTSEEHAREHMPDILKVAAFSKTNTATGEGVYDISFIDNGTGVTIPKSACIRSLEDCSLKANYNRSGSSEYIKADGSNAMIGEHFKFITSRGQSPLKCLKWQNTMADGSGTWSNTEQECGIGIYEDTGHPATVEIVASTGNFENVLLDKDCNNYVFNGANVVINGTSPCGMLNNGEAVVVVDNVISKMAVSEQGAFNLVNTKALLAETVNALTIEATNQLTARNADIEFLKVSGNSTFESNVTVLGAVTGSVGNFSNINSEINNLKTRDNALESATNRLRNEVRSNDSDISRINRRLSSLESVVTNLNSRSGGRATCNARKELYLSSGSSRSNRWITHYDLFLTYRWDGNTCQITTVSKTTGFGWTRND